MRVSVHGCGYKIQVISSNSHEKSRCMYRVDNAQIHDEGILYYICVWQLKFGSMKHSSRFDLLHFFRMDTIHTKVKSSYPLHSMSTKKFVLFCFTIFEKILSFVGDCWRESKKKNSKFFKDFSPSILILFLNFII